MTDFYDQDRLSKLREIMPRFVAHARVGDTIEFGLRGDPHFPMEFNDNRPTGEIVKIKNAGTESATIRVRTSKGALVNLPAHSIDPRRVWEYDTPTFERVLARSQPQPPSARNDESSYRSSNTSIANEQFEALQNRVSSLASQLDAEINESRNFNSALIASFSELANEVSRSSSTATPFANTFTKEYRGMMESGVLPRKEPSPFDSDFSDSDQDY